MTWIQKYRFRNYFKSSVWIVPSDRIPVLRGQLRLLDRALERNFPETEDRRAASMADYQGIGSSHLSHASDAGAME